MNVQPWSMLEQKNNLTLSLPECLLNLRIREIKENFIKVRIIEAHNFFLKVTRDTSRTMHGRKYTGEFTKGGALGPSNAGPHGYGMVEHEGRN